MELANFTLPLLTAALVAQAPELRVTPAARPGGQLDLIVLGQPSQPYATLVDATGGPRAALGQTFYLGLTGAVTVLDAGVLGLGGFRASSLPLPPQAPIGLPLFFQSVVAAPALAATDGESAVLLNSSAVIVQDFVDPAAQGITGTYDVGVRGRVQGAAAHRRRHDVVPNQGAVFSQPILGPLNPYGVRQQNVYRAADVGATGAAELLTAVRWKPFGPVAFDAFGHIEIRAAHSRVVPDYSVDPFSALPRYPDSGLSLTLAGNVKPGEQPVTVYSGGYIIDPVHQQADGFMPYPDLQGRFLYNGFDSLLLDFVVPPSTAVGVNGHRIYVMVQSSAQPNARAYSAGRPNRLVMQPDRITLADQGDNSWFEVQLEFLCLESQAVSPWLHAPVAAPDYHPPYVSQSVPVGASVLVEFRGATRPDGSDATPWLPSIDIADGLPFLQYRIRFFAAVTGGLAPSVDQLVIPVN